MDKNLSSWDGFTGINFLSADEVTGEDHVFVCVEVELDDDSRPMLSLESNGEKYKYSLNVTNANFLKEKGITSPKALIGKKLRFKKVQVTSPKTKKEVTSLRIMAVSLE